MHATANRLSLLLDLISRIRKHVYICTYAETMFLHLYVYIKYHKFTSQFQLNTTRFILAFPFPIILNVSICSTNLVHNQTSIPVAQTKEKRRKRKVGWGGGKVSLVPDTLAIIFWWISP